jgi:phage tail-like protein
MAQPGQRVDPYGNFNFLLEIEGIARATFAEVTGGDSTVDVTEYREGGDNTTPRKLPGQTKHANLVLRWGTTHDLELWNWHRDVVRGTVVRRNGSIVGLDRRNEEVARWNFVSAWPAKYDMPDFNAEGNDVAVESLELAHEGIERVS